MPLPDPRAVPNIDLTGKVVLVTGATGGLGEAIVHACARAGATVVLHGRVVRKLEALYDAIKRDGGAEPMILPLDLLNVGAPEFHAASTALQNQLGALDALVHTAAFLGSLGPLEHQSFDRWLEVMRVNVVAAMGLTRAMLPALARSRDASVTFTLDTRGLAPRAYWGAYGASKAALHALAVTAADEWEQRGELRVNAIVPGAIRSPLRMLTHPGEDKSAMPTPANIVPLYLHVIAEQPKQESGVCIDAPAWLAGVPAISSLLPAQATRSPLSHAAADAPGPSGGSSPGRE